MAAAASLQVLVLATVVAASSHAEEAEDRCPGLEPRAAAKVCAAGGGMETECQQQETVEEDSSLMQLHSLQNRTVAGHLPLIPYPAFVGIPAQSTKPFLLSDATQVVAGTNVSEAMLAVRLLRQLVAEAGLNAAHQLSDGCGAGSIQLELFPTSQGQCVEGYQLQVRADGVLLRAQSPVGLLYGAQTLTQLVLRERRTMIPAVSIYDHPRFAWRGLHLDVSRHFFSATEVKSLLESMAALKLNRFHWHLTDDQGWRLPIRGWPKLTHVGAQSPTGSVEAYSEEEVRGVVAYAQERHIEVVPEVDVPGHMAAAIAAYPELGNTDIRGWEPPGHPLWAPGVHEYTLAPSREAVAFLEAVFGQLAALFPGPFVHVGGDEAPEGQWKQSPRAASVLSSGAPTVQSFFNRKLYEIVQRHNRTLIGWDEVQHKGHLPPDAVVMAWRSKEELLTAVHAGRRAINTDQGKLYFDHYQSNPETEPKAFAGPIRLREVYDFDPMPSGLTPEQQEYVLGAQAQLWSEYFPTWRHVEYMAFPRLFALAERLWTPSSQITSFGNFRSRLRVRLHDLDRRQVHYRKLDH